MYPLRPLALVAALAVLVPIARCAAAQWKPASQVEIVALKELGLARKLD